MGVGNSRERQSNKEKENRSQEQGKFAERQENSRTGVRERIKKTHLTIRRRIAA